MKRILKPRLYSVLCACSLLCACTFIPPDSTINWRFGTPSLHPRTGRQLCRSFETYRPETLRELQEYMGKAPDAEWQAPEGKYSLWGYKQTNAAGHIYAAKVCCLSKNGKIEAVASLYPNRWGTGISSGDKYLFDSAVQPEGLKKACDIYFRNQERNRAAHFGKRVEFAPQGETSVLLGPHDKLLGWNGDEPVVSWAQQATQGTAAPAPDFSPVVDVLSNPQTWQVPDTNDSYQQQMIAERNRIKNQILIDEQRKKAEIQAENIHQLNLKRARESGKINWGY